VQGRYQLATTVPRSHRPSLQYTVLFSIRDFHNSDFETLWHIDQRCFAPGISYSRPELFAYISMQNAFTLVAAPKPETEKTPNILKDEIAPGGPGTLGFVVASLNNRGAGHVITIDVIPEAQRSGIGSALLTAAEERLKLAGSTCIRLETAVNNTAALAFYKRHGYTVFKTIPRYYPDGLDAFVMQKDLLSHAPGG
jgi:ribosomal-protein-alanine N-acetyltransferase